MEQLNLHDLLGLFALSFLFIGMAWNDGIDRATGYIVTATNWNDLIGAAGSLMQLKSHAHGGTTGEGSQSLGPLVLEDFTDAAAPAAPAAGRTRLYTVSGQPRYRPNGGADRQIITDQSTAAGDLAGTYPNPTVAKITLGSDADGDLYYRSGGVLVRLAKGTALQSLQMNAGATAPIWATGAASILDKIVATTTVVNTVTETDLYRKTVAGNTIGANGVLRLTLWGDYLNNAGGGTQYRFKVIFGGTTVLDTGLGAATASSASRGGWQLQIMLWNIGATNSQRVAASLSMALAGTVFSMVAGLDALAIGDGTAAEDTTAAKDLAFRVIMQSANANLDIRAKEGLLELFA